MPLRPTERRPLPRVILLSAAIVLCGVLSTACGALLLLGGGGASAIAFATGELSSQEEVALEPLDEATGKAIEALGYESIEVTRAPTRVRWQATTPSGDPVDVHLTQKDEEETELRIRIGVFGDETRSRLLLEEIHRAL